MQNAIAESLPIALGMILATLPVVAIPLILLTRREPGILLAFLSGYAGGFIVLGSVVMLAADLLAANPDGPPRWILWLRMALGILLLGLAWRKWKIRATDGGGTELPGWMQTIDTINGPRAGLLGFLLVVVNPKNAALVISGALAIASATTVPLAQWGALAVFTAVSSLGIAAPWFLWLAMGERAIGPLDRLKAVMARHNSLIMTAILVVLGLVVILNTLGYL